MNKADLVDWSLHHAMSAMPPAMCSALGARLSPIMGRKAHPEQHANAMRLLTRLRPDFATAPGGIEGAVDRLWANVGRTFAEFAVSHRMLRRGHVVMEGEEIFAAAMASGRPILAIFPHLGNWELSEMQFGFRVPGRVGVVVDPPASTARAQIAEQVRSKVPLEMMLVSRTVWRQAIARLKRPGGILMLAVDEVARGDVCGPALGRPPRVDGNLGKAARLALASGAMVLPFHNERLPGARFKTHVLPPLTLQGAAGDEGAIAAAVERMDAVMREPIVRLLDQWYMALNIRG